jgi:hypothetical protein
MAFPIPISIKAPNVKKNWCEKLLWLKTFDVVWYVEEYIRQMKKMAGTIYQLGTKGLVILCTVKSKSAGL